MCPCVYMCMSVCACMCLCVTVCMCVLALGPQAGEGALHQIRIPSPGFPKKQRRCKGPVAMRDRGRTARWTRRHQLVLRCRRQAEASRGRPAGAWVRGEPAQAGRIPAGWSCRWGRAQTGRGGGGGVANRCSACSPPPLRPTALRLDTQVTAEASGQEGFSTPGPLLVGALSSQCPTPRHLHRPPLPAPAQTNPLGPLRVACCRYLARGGASECPGGLGAPGPPLQSRRASGCGVRCLWACGHTLPKPPGSARRRPNRRLPRHQGLAAGLPALALSSRTPAPQPSPGTRGHSERLLLPGGLQLLWPRFLPHPSRPSRPNHTSHQLCPGPEPGPLPAGPAPGAQTAGNYPPEGPLRALGLCFPGTRISASAGWDDSLTSGALVPGRGLPRSGGCAPGVGCRGPCFASSGAWRGGCVVPCPHGWHHHLLPVPTPEPSVPPTPPLVSRALSGIPAQGEARRRHSSGGRTEDPGLLLGGSKAPASATMGVSPPVPTFPRGPGPDAPHRFTGP